MKFRMGGGLIRAAWVRLIEMNDMFLHPPHLR